ncbi:S41 family peptidase [Chitinophaga barathri]|uniref:Tricorn protease homolog n=1 Tax=Chitinophaga barathri TaxID=1647451 RepID=A0A3N4M5Z0_9BACT|nr:S41 family peptidase [Chitinophaga barathri]RPD38744.1 peptidase S41 [Chitinophaga barathri]
MRVLFPALLAASLYLPAKAQTTEAYFTTYPTLTPDGQTVIFSFEGDLWKADIQNPHATRLTAMQGNETLPKVSPDGKWIAFTAYQFGNADVFLIPIDGGEVRQLTMHEASDQMESWSWDSRSVYFTSGRAGNATSYKVGIDGGTPVRIFPHYFNLIHNVVEHPSSGELFFNDTWESSNQANRKRYKGDFNPDIQSYIPATKAYKRYTDYRGKDLWTTIDRKGNIYFTSDEANGEYNLYTFANGAKKALTSFPTSIKRPFANANGGKVVFEKDYQVWIYDVAAGKAEKLPVKLFRNPVLPKEQGFEVKDRISHFDVSPDGKKLAFISRGELFVSDIEGKFVRQLSRPAERAMQVQWLADNRTLLFNQTLNGYLNWYTIPADGSGTAKQLTGDKRNNRQLTMNKTRTQAVYLSGRDEVRVMDLKTLESKTAVKDEIWAFQNADPRFSPNDEYIVFTAYRNFESDILVHNLKKNTTTNLTNTGVTETTPYWSPDGKYIYFTSSRTKPSYPFGMSNAKVYRIPLEKLDEPYRADKFDELFKKEEKKDTSKTAAKTQPVTGSITIDADRIMQRTEQISPDFGGQYGPYHISQKGDKSTVYFFSNHADGKGALWKTVIEPFEENKTDKIAGTERGASTICEVDGKLYALSGGNINKLNPDANKLDAININMSFYRNLGTEFRQIFYETWANVEENFYNADFHGTNWTKLRDDYSRYLPYINNRGDLRILLNDLLGELNSSHLGFNSSGDEEKITLSYRTMETGIEFDNQQPYKVNRIVTNSSADKHGIDIRPGDVLTKVNGTAVETNLCRDQYFTRPSFEKEMVLSFERGGKTFDVKLHPQPSYFIGNQLYDEWIAGNEKRVDQLSSNKVAYTCMKNMGTFELEKFLIDMAAKLGSKDALILDLRYNTGGNVHDEVLKFLSQRPYLQWQYREGKLSPQPNFAPAGKPIVLLINEQSLSDAEMTAAGFKALKLGKIIGTESYRWIIFTSGKGLVDGSFYRLPSWGCYTLDGKNLEKEGVAPDIYVKTTFADRLENKDPQLERAVQEVLKDLK